MRGTVFYKMTGSGNDFVMLDGRFTRPDDWPAERIRAVCDRRTGVGADGLVILTPEAPSTVRMAYWNSDGSRAAMCGNAALCSGRLAADLEMAGPGEVCLLSDVGLVRVRVRAAADQAEVQMPDLELPRAIAGIDPGAGERWIVFVVAGVPHLVVRVNRVDEVDLPARGRELRFHPRVGPAGANVNFVSPPPGGDGPWLIRTYERGVEGETLACGTGTVASGLALAAAGESRLPVRFRSRGGPELQVRAELRDSSAAEVWLGGQGRSVFRGVWEG